MRLHRILATLFTLAIISMTMAAGQDCEEQHAKNQSARAARRDQVAPGKQGPSAPTVIHPVTTGADKKPASQAPTTVMAAADPNAPVITAQRNPDLVLAAFPRPMVDGGMVGRACGADTIFLIKPSVQASCYWNDRGTVALKAADGLKFYDGFDVELVQVQTGEGVLRSPRPGAWSAAFKFTVLKVDSVRDVHANLSDHHAEMQIVFTAPVAPAELPKHLDLKLNNQPLEKIEVKTTGRPEVLSVTARLPRPGLVNDLKLTIAKGLPCSAPGVVMEEDYQHDFDLGSPPRIEIRRVNVNEGDNGYYLFVPCEDYAAGYRACQIDQDSFAEKVKIEPAVKPRLVAGHGGFRIYGDFHEGGYKISIGRGLATESGGMLLSDLEYEFKVPKRTPKASFVAKGRYVARSRLAKVPVKHINVDSITITARRIPESNLVFWLSGQQESFDDRTSDVVASKTFKVDNKPDRERTSWLDLSPLAPADARGVYEFTATGGNRPDSIRVVLTNLSLVAKRSGQGGKDLAVWALNSETLAPEKDVAIEVVTVSNRVIASAKTDNDGLASFANLSDPIKEADKGPFVLFARAKDDLTLLKFGDLQVPLSEYRVEGDAYHAAMPYRAVIYSDRGVYRPGETAHVASIVWEDGDHAPAKAIPLVARLKDPRGKDAQVIAAKTNDAGMAVFDLPFDDYAATGKYDFIIEVGSVAAGAYSFQVEEFVPERMKVTASPIAAEISAAEEPAFWVQADYLFGAPAKGEKLEAKCTVEPADLSFDKYPGYTFSVWRDEPMKPLPLGSVTDTLSDKGSATVSCPAVADVVSMKGPASVKILASVFEAGSGRTSVAHASIKVHPDLHYIGLKTGSKTAAAGQKVDVEGVVVDWRGDLAAEAAQVDVELVELESEWSWEYDDDEGSYQSSRYVHEASLQKSKVAVKDGRFKYSFTPAHAAEAFLVRATIGPRIQTDLHVRGEGYSWYWEEYYSSYRGGSDRTPGPMAPEGIVLNLPPSIQTGAPVPVAADLPYPGRLLLTVETDRVIEAHWYDVKPGPFTAEFTLHEFAPNVYVSALLVKDPFFESKNAYMPGRAFGVTSVKVEPVRHVLSVKLTAPAEMQPNQELAVRLDVAGARNGRLYATVAAVDEGVLQLTQFLSPDPLSDMFHKRGLAVSTFETIGWTMLLPPASPQSTGGDGAEEEAYDTGAAGKRVQPIKPVALWSGLVDVGADGKAIVKFQVPTYRGKLRIMAVAATPDRMGSASAQTLVRDPLVLQPSFPRFLIAGDEIVTPVFITNMTGAPQTITVELKSSPEVLLRESAVKSLVLEANQSGTVTFLSRVNAGYGAASFDVTASAGKFRSTDHAELPIFLNGGETHDLFLHSLKPGTNELIADLKGWTPESEKTTVTLTNNRYARELGHLKYLIQYPYGCIEQTTSTTRPLLYIANLVAAVDPEAVKNGGIEEKFMFGVRRLFSMQTPQGGFSYWPGQSANTYWGTAYATHVMLEGLDAGYPINKDRVGDALTFMETILNYNPDFTDPKYGYSVATSEPYMQFVLARAGRGRAGRIQKLIENPNSGWGELKDENLYLLKAALYLMGDATYEKDLKHPSVAAEPKRQNGWSFWSELRQRGMELEIAQDVLKDSSSLEPLAQSIASSLQGNSYSYTTQELSWCVSALGKRASLGATSWSDPVLSLDGKSIPPLAAPKGSNRNAGWRILGASSLKSMNLVVDKIQGGNLFALVRVEGIKPGVPPETGDHSLAVRRTYRNEKGDVVDLKNVGLGDLVYVELTLENQTDDQIRNVAMVDRFGAGFEIENPRLGRQHAVQWADQDSMWDTDYMNIRDDRIELFGSLPEERTVTRIYVIRAVTGGVFTTPPVRAEAMYDPEKWSQQTGDTVKIKDPWGAITD